MVAVDISGRHTVNRRYLMVCAAVVVKISPESIEKIYDMKLVPQVSESIDLDVVVTLIEKAVRGLSGVVIAEKGDLYNQERWKIECILSRQFKYPESLGERRAIEFAHHASFAGRNLMLDLLKR